MRVIGGADTPPPVNRKGAVHRLNTVGTFVKMKNDWSGFACRTSATTACSIFAASVF